MQTSLNSSPRPSLPPFPPRPDSDEEEDLLDLFLSLAREERRLHFADTAGTAELVGVSRRTIQQWIDGGLIRAVSVGHKYQVLLESVRSYLKVCGQQRA